MGRSFWGWGLAIGLELSIRLKRQRGSPFLGKGDFVIIDCLLHLVVEPIHIATAATSTLLIAGAFVSAREWLLIGTVASSSTSQWLLPSSSTTFSTRNGLLATRSDVTIVMVVGDEKYDVYDS